MTTRSIIRIRVSSRKQCIIWKSLARFRGAPYLYSVVGITLKKLLQIILKYRLLHFGVWIYVFLTDLHLKQSTRPDEAHQLINWVDAINNLLWSMVSAYVVILYLFPRYYIKEQFGKFTGLALLTVFLSALLNILMQVLYVRLMMKGAHVNMVVIMVTSLAKIFDNLIYTLLFFMVVLIWHYFQKDQKNKKIERDHLLNELEFLKAQMNPHFVFNAINSIYVLMKLDMKASEDVLLRFSSLLRYQLYECGQGEAWLSKEIQFIKDYVELEKIRLGDKYAVRMDIGEPREYYRIAPFVLFPFVENAFKHLSHYESEPNTVLLNIQFNSNSILFHLQNSFEAVSSEQKKEGGIGLRNVKRRLELLYPGKYHLEHGERGKEFYVHLELELNEDQMYHHR